MLRTVFVSALAAVALVACGQTTATAPTAVPAATGAAPTAATGAAGGTLVVLTYDSFDINEDVLNAFQQETGITVEFRKSGDAGEALNRAILSKNSPQGDVLFGIDNTFLSRALGADLFEPYSPAALANVPDTFKLDTSGALTPVDYGYVTINYDRAFLQEHNLSVPQSLQDLTGPEWKGKLIVENPATSSPGLAFLLATIGTFGTEGDYTWKNYWQDLKANDVLVTNGWDEAYYTQFSGSSGKGPRPLVVSYATSPAAEVYFSETPPAEAPTGNVLAGSFLQVEFAGILKGTNNRAAAERFIDFLLSKDYQESIPLQLFVYPVLEGAAQPEVFTKYAEVPAEPASVAPDAIEQNRDTWINEWTQIVLR